jgi:hypothetical protein
MRYANSEMKAGKQRRRHLIVLREGKVAAAGISVQSLVSGG